MLYHARFCSRPNRFISRCELNGSEIVCHVKNTGRLRELLVPGQEVLVRHQPEPGRKTAWTLTHVVLPETLVSIDSQLPNQVAANGIRDGSILLPGFAMPDTVKTEQRYGDSRFDLYLEKDGKRAFAEVKGVTLVRDGTAQFPDAPTERGIKHLQELGKAIEDGYAAFVLFMIQRSDAEWFAPNPDRPEFAEALRKAAEKGVTILPICCRVTEEGVFPERVLPYSL